jgi:hypothetical protein
MKKPGSSEGDVEFFCRGGKRDLWATQILSILFHFPILIVPD